MRFSVRLMLCAAVLTAVTSAGGCGMVPRRTLAASQNRSRQLWEQNRSLAMERDGAARQLGEMASENARLQGQLSDAQANANTLQSRVDNLLAERSQIQTRAISNSSPLSGDITQQLQDLVKKYPEFEFDATTGVSKFQTDVIFDSGSDELKSTAEPLLRDFAAIMNKGNAKDLHVLVVGHTDNRRIAKPQTKARHSDNMYLSTNRAHTVRKSLEKYGITSGRFGAAGYGPYQPVAANTDAKGRERNRRVEIFVMAPGTNAIAQTAAAEPTAELTSR